MSIHAKQSRGRTVYKVRFRDPNTRKEIARTFPTKKEAQAFQAAQTTAKYQGIWIDQRDGNKLLPEVAARWLASNPAKRPNTYATDESAIRKHIGPALPGRIGAYSQADIQKLVDTWKLTYAPRYVRRMYGVVQAIFAYAVASRWLAQSPCQNIKLPPVTGTRRYKLTDENVEAIATAIDGRYEAMVWIGRIMGLRWSEVAGLRVWALGLLNRTLTIRKGGTIIRDKKGTPVTSDPKSAASHATLPLPSVLVDILAEHLAARGLTAADGSHLIFEAPEGGPLRSSNFRNRIWLPATIAAGVGGMIEDEEGKPHYKGAGFHDLRRANATSVASENDPKAAQAILRHSDIRLTLNVYAEAEADNVAAAIDRQGARFNTRATKTERGLVKRSAG
jgi:integrase